MSDLTKIDKLKLEKLFEMGEGYVLDFSNRTFEEFFLDTMKLDIEQSKYYAGGSSKANRLRTFWRIESNYKVSNSITKMIEYYNAIYSDNLELLEEKKNLIEECILVANRLQNDISSEQVVELEDMDINDIDVELLLKDIRDSIERDEPVLALDRLHTYSVKYIRYLCDKHELSYDNTKPLHSCYGEYIKNLEKENLLETDMTKKILKYSISIFDAYNYVRNNQSFAHDNELLNYDESLLIYRSMTSILAFIRSLEDKLDSYKENRVNNVDDNWLSF